MTLHFLIPGDISTLTGGYVYDKIIIDGLKKLGYAVKVHQLGNDFPFPSAESLNQCNTIFAGIPVREPVFIDSLAFGSMHKILTKHKNKNPVIAIMHLPLSKNPNFSTSVQNKLAQQEKNAFTNVHKIIAVSEFTGKLIMEYGINQDLIKVIIPGVFNTSRKTVYPDYPENLLCVGSYLKGKGQILLVHALAKLRELPWTINMYGIQDFDPLYVQKIKQKVEAENLSDRIFVNPQISNKKLSAAYLNADLFILPSYFENFSMALNDALNYGIPVITTSGGGIPYSVPDNMGIFVKPGNVTDLEQAIQSVLTNSLQYKKLYLASSQYYKSANKWENSIDLFHSLVLNI